jgi:hypothetical protein
VDLYGLVSISGSSYINYKMGAESATPTYATDVPAVTAGYKKIAEVFIPTTGLGHSAIYANQIIDKRTLLAPGGMFSVSGTVALDAGTGIASLVDLVAPPGVCVATYFVPAGGGSPAQILVYIILVDHETSGGVYPRAVGSMHCTTPVSTTDLYVARAAMLNAAVNSTTQGYMATAVPPVAVAVYQPTLVLNAAIVHQAAGVTDASIPAGTSGWAFSVNIGV